MEQNKFAGRYVSKYRVFTVWRNGNLFFATLAELLILVIHENEVSDTLELTWWIHFRTLNLAKAVADTSRSFA